MMLEIWNKDHSVISTPMGSVVLNTGNESVLKTFDHVFTTGEAYYGNESLAICSHRQAKREIYFNYVFQPLKDEYDNTATILITANEVTDQVLSRLIYYRRSVNLNFIL
ncbi:hypothetical protein [Pedobacter hartonius]|uniref:Uncharacterized protein n=1 Tax=Pedobacter hartonius TaxID=425514 RepID=A0A1H4H908_9SPHI|nr:hypothetical protein [Pedobacter hartonius]SEB18307.1 hypothetical protein SAMN05443550_11489 [Pedobacter hartonius]